MKSEKTDLGSNKTAGGLDAEGLEAARKRSRVQSRNSQHGCELLVLQSCVKEYGIHRKWGKVPGCKVMARLHLVQCMHSDTQTLERGINWGKMPGGSIIWK